MGWPPAGSCNTGPCTPTSPRSGSPGRSASGALPSPWPCGSPRPVDGLVCCGLKRRSGDDECPVGLTGQVTLEASDDLRSGLALPGPPGDVGAGAWVPAQAADGEHVQGPVGVAVAAPAQ